jgi:vitamin B12/bleomycin/antimicrobial peptide transport system ATP-binding/permease protein
MDVRGSASAHLEKSRQTSLALSFWRTARNFWFSNAYLSAWILTAAAVAFVILEVYFQYRLNVWNRVVFDALEQRDGSIVRSQALLFVPLAIGSTASAILIVYFRMKLQRRWREWLTEHLLDRWLKKGRYYQLNFIPGPHENPEYRLSEDMRIATEAPIDFVSGITTSILTAATFITVLWVVGGDLPLEWGGTQIVVPRFLVLAVVLYCLITSGAMVVIARSFVPIAERKNQTEAEFRYALTRIRENGESIAILGGEAEERAGLSASLTRVIDAWRQMANQYMRTTGVSHSNFIIATVVPVILCAPKYLDGTMSLGQVTQATAAFIQVQYAFNWIVNNYPRLAEWTASARRVASLLAALDSLDAVERDKKVNAIIRAEGGSAVLHLRGLKVVLSDGTVVVEDADVKVERGERVLLAGESGSGKSTLVRALAGLWPWGEGQIITAPGAKIFLMPQKPYIPLGSLRRAVAYPLAGDSIADDELKSALGQVGLESLAARLDDEEPWANVLSGGEQQRLSFARLLLHRPDIVVLDESTSALDVDSQETLMTRLRDLLPEMAMISVGHRQELELFHERKLNLIRQEGGAKLISDEPSAPPISPLAVLLKRWGGPMRGRASPTVLPPD